MKIAVLIADTYGEPFKSLKSEFLEKIWGDSNANVSVYTMIGQEESVGPRVLNSISNYLKYTKFWPIQRLLDEITLFKYKIYYPKVQCIGNEIVVRVPEGLRYLGPKFLASAKHLFDSGYDVVYKTTLSSVVQHELLQAKLRTISSEKIIYAGSRIGRKNYSFVSGANLLINRDMFDLVKKHRLWWNFADYDDVALGKIARKNKVRILEVDTLNLDSLDSLAGYTDLELSEIMHFRCKSSAKFRNDGEIISSLLERLSRNRDL